MYKIIVRSVCINVDCNVVTFLDVYLINYLIYLLRIVAAFAPTIFSGHKLWHTFSSSIYKSQDIRPLNVLNSECELLHF